MATRTELLDKLVTEALPAKVEHSPLMYSKGLRDILRMSYLLGLPTHFITITQDEFGRFRAPEFAALDAMIKTWHQGSLKDHPLEASRLINTLYNLSSDDPDHDPVITAALRSWREAIDSDSSDDSDMASTSSEPERPSTAYSLYGSAAAGPWVPAKYVDWERVRFTYVEASE